MTYEQDWEFLDANTKSCGFLLRNLKSTLSQPVEDFLSQAQGALGKARTMVEAQHFKIKGLEQEIEHLNRELRRKHNG